MIDIIKVAALAGTGVFLILVGSALFFDSFLEAAGGATISWYSHNSLVIRQVLARTWTVLGVAWIGFGLHLAYEWGWI